MYLQERPHVPKAAKCLQILNTTLLAGIKKKGGSPQNRCRQDVTSVFRRYTPESRGAESRVKSLTGGLLSRPLMVVWCPQTASPLLVHHGTSPNPSRDFPYSPLGLKTSRWLS